MLVGMACSLRIEVICRYSYLVLNHGAMSSLSQGLELGAFGSG